LKNQTTKEVEGVLCVNRETHTCIILQADVDRLEDLVAIARAMKVPNVQLIVPKAAVKELEAYGWAPIPDLVVVTK
jgi:hypothetical protein